MTFPCLDISYNAEGLWLPTVRQHSSATHFAASPQLKESCIITEGGIYAEVEKVSENAEE